MNKKVLKPIYYTVTILAASLALTFSLLNMNGCTSLVGPQGDQGQKGEKGDNGEKGEPGKKGETGDTGEKGDTGSKGETGDQGQKGDQGEKGDTGTKGDTGDKGDKGNTGSKGSTGSDADKYYNCVILPSEKGYVTLDKGSYKVGDTVTFTLHPNSSCGIVSFEVNGEDLITDLNRFKNESFAIETTMVENGLVVVPNFARLSTNGTNAILDLDTMICYDTMDQIYTLKKSSSYDYIYWTTVNLKLYKDATLSSNFNLYFTTLNLDLGNNHTLTASAYFTAYYYGGINVTGKGKIINETSSYMFAIITGMQYSLNLTIGSNVTTKCTNGSAILLTVGKKSDGSTYTNGDYSKIVYNGTDYSKRLLYVNEGIKKSSDAANIAIYGATVYSNMYLAGFANYVIKDSTFYTSETAINAKSGNITLTNNTFNVDLGESYTRLKAAYVSCSSGSFGGDATVVLSSGISGYAGFETFNISGNAFNGTTLQDTWYDFLIYKENNTDIVPTITDSTYKVLTNSDFEGKIKGATFTYSSHTYTCDIYFLTTDEMYAYTPQNFLDEYLGGSSSYTVNSFDNKYCTRNGDSWSDQGAKPAA